MADTWKGNKLWSAAFEHNAAIGPTLEEGESVQWCTGYCPESAENYSNSTVDICCYIAALHVPILWIVADTP